MRRALFLALVALLALPAAAQAHARLVGTAPERGATLRAAPQEVVFRFNEPVEAAFGAVRVYDGTGKEVDDRRLRSPGGDSHRVAVGLPRGLADGTYTAVYRLISADGHPISGGLVFSVGEAGAGPSQTIDELLGASSGPVTGTAFSVARATTYAATAVVLGGLLVLGLCWLPAVAGLGLGAGLVAARAALRARAQRLLAAGALAGLVAGAAGLVLQGAVAGGTSFWTALDPDVVREVLETRLGTAYGVREGAWLALLAGVLVLARRALPRPRVLAALLALPLVVLAAAPALGGHAGVTSPRGLTATSDVVHVVAMSAWLGGLALLLLALPRATAQLEPADRTKLLAAVLTRFSPLALACVVALLVTGTVQSVIHLTAFSELLDTAFGRAILVKVVLLAGLIALGAVNQRRVVPALRHAAATGRTPGGPGVLLRRTLRGEVVLALAVLGATGALTGYAPPASSAGGPFAERVAIGPLDADVTVDPAGVGPNELHLYLFRRSDGAQFEGAKEVTATMALPGGDIPELPVTLRLSGPGHYVADRFAVGRTGTWRLRVVVRVSDFDEFRKDVDVRVR
ncbi:copper resistance protein CopC [Conexibacter sp. SYSU D00693]|uniref:copper resistance CopC/CopD family protein n=1 Tax=Conexibacter sp. SYSU D00693 TaxID=2812560 RepID=UPI00196B881E|nr:copper resistance protein CopC [Conexibacter sp. SYSU D00693]